MYLKYFLNDWFAYSLFLKSDVSESLRSPMSKEQLWANRLPKIRDHERFTQVTHKMEQPWASRSGCSLKISELANCLFFFGKSLLCLFFWGNCSFAHFLQKWSICSENWWVNSQPWIPTKFKTLFFFSKKNLVSFFLMIDLLIPLF